MKKFLLGILVGFVFAGMAGVIFFFVAVRLATARPGIPDNSVLALRVEGDIPEQPPVTIPLPWFERQVQPTVRDYWEMLRKAAADRRVRAVVLLPSNVGAGWAKLDELRAQIAQFRRSGKPVYAWLQAPRARDYYLALAADRIFLPPEDALDLKGMRFELMYLKGTLDKLGVEVVVEHAGIYKDAPEMFTHKGPSPPSREAINSLLDGLYGQLVGAIAQGRKKSEVEVRAMIDRGPFLSPQARAEGLVDELKHLDEVFGELDVRLKTSNMNKLAVADYLTVTPAEAGIPGGAQVGVVVAQGSIVRQTGDGLLGDDDMVSPAELRALMRRAGEDSRLRGVILRVDSPGGDSFASDEMLREVKLLSKKKPVVISMSDTAASGGYYIAMSGDPVIAYPGTITGSIGVFYGKANLRGLYDKVGITKEVLARGRFADLDSDYTELTPEGRAKLASIVQQTYQTFLTRVAEGRKRKVEEVAKVAEGRVWLGTQARANGLVDRLGGLDAAVELIRTKAGLGAGDRVMLVAYPPRRSLLEQLMSQPAGPTVRLRLPAAVRAVSTANWMRGGVFYRMPMTLELQ